MSLIHIAGRDIAYSLPIKSTNKVLDIFPPTTRNYKTPFKISGFRSIHLTIFNRQSLLRRFLFRCCRLSNFFYTYC